MAETRLRIGIDVGGTNTDAVILDQQDRLLAKVKHPTTPDVTTGILSALKLVLGQLDGAARQVRHVMLGTTHATNAILERRNLNRVATLRLGGPATHSIPPLLGWPAELRAAISCGTAVVDGGVEMTGEPIVPLDEEAVRKFLESVRAQADCVAVSGVFSPVLSDQELRAEELVREILGDVPVSLSHEIGSLGLLERENACVLNAALVGVAARVTAGLTDAMTANGIVAEAYLAQNDGTLMSLDYVRRYPVLTIGSGPTNSMRGASYLTGATDALVVDVGGTSTDIGILTSGFPRESSTAVEVGGVRTNFRMPDLVSVAIGGGTIVREASGAVVLGPGSVGYRLPEEALVFGGKVATLTDAMVAAGRARGIGDAALVAGREDLLRRAIAECDVRIEDAVDRLKSSGRELPLVAVGGGSGLIPGTLAGVAEVLRPENCEVANAIGAAIATVSGEVDRVFAFGEGGRDEAMAEATQLARDEAVRAGADPAHVEVVEIDEVPLAYLTEPVARIRVKAAGPLRNG
jgi:N-methylhydantoinase A/oxoprolinase/acetone carboxylase beta subunit